MPVAVSGLVEWLLTDTDMIVILIVTVKLNLSQKKWSRGRRVGQPPSSHLAWLLVNSPCPGILCTVTHDWA